MQDVKFYFYKPSEEELLPTATDWQIVTLATKAASIHPQNHGLAVGSVHVKAYTQILDKVPLVLGISSSSRQTPC